MIQKFPLILFKNIKTEKIVNFIGEAEDAETHEIVCVYEDFLKSDNDIRRMWTRPKDIFFSKVWNGSDFVPKYKQISSISDIFTREELEELQGIIKGTIECQDKVKQEIADYFRYNIMGC